MNRQQNQIFRKSSIDRMNSPEQLNDYIKVANPGVWITLAAVILLLLGMLIWAVFGTIETKTGAGLRVENGVGTAYIAATEIGDIAAGQQIEAGGVVGTITAVSKAAGESGLEDPVYVVRAELPGLADGTYAASITLERIHPIRFILQ